jgi:hypothetical protein
MYSKLFKARNNPENKCFAKDDEVLTIVPKKELPKKECKHHFIGALTEEKSQYGWVSDVKPFTLEEFIKKYGFNTSDDIEKEYVKIMLDAASKQKPNTHMAADFVMRGAMQKKMVLTVHKVFFYDSKAP